MRAMILAKNWSRRRAGAAGVGGKDRRAAVVDGEDGVVAHGAVGAAEVGDQAEAAGPCPKRTRRICPSSRN